MSAVIFNGNKVKTLKAGINLFNNATIWSGNLDPSVTGFAANLGDTYISTLTLLTYTKTTAPNTGWTAQQNATVGDIPLTSFTAADNVSNQLITGLTFSDTTIRSVEVLVSITRASTYEQVKLNAVQRGADWSYATLREGDDTGVTVSIDNAGFGRYTSTSTGSTAKLSFRAIVTAV